MTGTILCLLDAGAKVHIKDGAESYTEIAEADGLDQTMCQLYRFDLTNRRLLADRGTPAGNRAARAYIDGCMGTPEKLMQFAAEGHLSKGALIDLVVPDRRRAYADACAVIEKAYTDACAATNDPCLESGCAIEGEICLQPLLNAGIEYRKQCAAEWVKMFVDAENRIDAWRS